MEDIQRIKEHLENIRSIEPILTSLRTISAGGWRLALRRLRVAEEYMASLSQVLSVASVDLSDEQLHRAHVSRTAPPNDRVAMLVIASERGLCGAFNDVTLGGAERLIEQQELRSDQVLVVTLGRRAEAYFRAKGRDLHMARALPVTRVASFAMVAELAQELLGLLAGGTVDAVYVVCSPYEAARTAEPVSRLWLPVDFASLPAVRTADRVPPIVETDHAVLFQETMRHWTYARLFQLVMESAASEQSARFRAMDSASSNLERIIEELTLSYHTARQHAITMEMLDLVAGSGILDRDTDGQGDEGD